MGYEPPGIPAFSLETGPYTPPGPQSVDFYLAEAGSAPGIEYPIPPGIMVTSGLSVTMTSAEPASLSGIDYGNNPARRAIRRALRSSMAASQLDGRASQEWDKVPGKDEAIAEGVQRWGAAGHKDPAHAATRWETVPIKDDDRGGPSQAWDGSIRPMDPRTAQIYQYPSYKDVDDGHGHRDSAKLWEPPKDGDADGRPYVPGSLDFNLRLGSYLPPAGNSADLELGPIDYGIDYETPTRPVFGGLSRQGWESNLPADIRARHPWDTKPRKGTEVEFDFSQEQPIPTDPPDQPEIKRAYIIMNSSSLIAVSEDEPLQFSDLSIELDADSFSWKMTCSILNRESMDLIRPTAAGPAEVLATINGHEWRFIVERYSLDRQFANERWRINGVSRAQLLAEPYALKRTARIEDPTNMALAMADQLEFTGFSTELQQGLRDYVIPAGAWGYENKNAMEVIVELADAVGAIIVPHRTEDVLQIRHRYKQTVPWQFDELSEAELDAIVPDSMVIGFSSQWRPQPEYNYVFISGVTDGVATEVIRQGTAGDVAAPDIFDDLNVDAQQCRQRGISALAEGGNQEIVTIETVLPTSGAPGLIEPGMIVEYRYTKIPEDSWRGIVLSTSISVSNPGAGRVIQNLKIERHHY